MVAPARDPLDALAAQGLELLRQAAVLAVPQPELPVVVTTKHVHLPLPRPRNRVVVPAREVRHDRLGEGRVVDPHLRRGHMENCASVVRTRTRTKNEDEDEDENENTRVRTPEI